jgi:hypothetical protein
MLSVLVGLGLLILIPLFLLAVVFDVAMFALALGFKAFKIGVKILFGVLGIIGLIFTIPLFICILILI